MLLDRLRGETGYHEWLMVSRYDDLRALGFTLSDIRSARWRTPTDAVFRDPNNPEVMFREFDARRREEHRTPTGFADTETATRLSARMHAEIGDAISRAQDIARDQGAEAGRHFLERRLTEIQERWIVR